MLKRGVIGIAAAVGLAVSAGAVALADGVPSVRVISELDHSEPFEALSYTAGYLWVGSSRHEFNSEYRLRVYTADGTLVKEMTLPHSLAYIQPYGTDGVIVTGTGTEPNLTQYTIVRRSGNDFTASTHQIPAEAWAYQWVGRTDREYFIDFSGNTNDPQRDADPSLASETIFQMSGGTPRYLTTRIRAPIVGTLVGNELYIVHREAIGLPQSGAVRVNLSTQAGEELFPQHRDTLNDVIYLPMQRLVAFTESGANQVLLYDPATRTLKDPIAVGGSPRSLATFGRCLAVGSEADKTARLIDLSGATPQIVGTYSFASAGDKFMGLRKISTDAASGQIFARSAYPCAVVDSACPADRNSVVALTIPAGDAALAACR